MTQNRNTTPLVREQRIIPHLIAKNASAAVEFYVDAFGAVEDFRLADPEGRIHAELTINGARFMLADEYPEVNLVGPETRGGTTSSVAVYVDDVDALASRAVAAGATLECPIADQFYGDRVAWLRDPFGHRWSFHTRIEDVPVDEMKRRFATMMER